jgi:pilus assembly protein CpaB
MRLVFGLVLLIGIGIAAFAVSVAKDRFDQYQVALATQQEAILPTTQVYVMSEAVRYGDLLRPEDVTLIRWPAEHVPFGAFTDEAALFPPGAELRTVLRAMERDEPVLLSKITDPGADAGVASRLSSGMRAIAIRVDVTTGVSGFLRPGDQVDVYWTGTGRDGSSVTRLIRSNVQIVAIDQIADESRNNPTIARTITVSAMPEDLVALTQAQATGSLTLALVGVGDTTISAPVEVSIDALWGDAAADNPQRPRICTVRTRRGSEVVVIEVPCTN